MKDNLFNLMQDKDWKIFQIFTKKNLVKSFITNQRFNKFWFKRKKWTVYIKKNKNKIYMLNMFIVLKAKYFKKKELEEELYEAGFKIENLTHRLGYSYTAICSKFK